MTDRTIQTYDRIAATYAEANRNRSTIVPFLEAFAAQMPAGGRVLDIGCGPGFDTNWLRQRQFNAIGVDLSTAMIATAQHEIGGDFVQADMRHLPFGRFVDGILVNAALLHISRSTAPAVVAGFHAVLRSGGVLGVAVKHGGGEQWAQNSYGHAEPRFFVYWSDAQLDALLTDNGFTIVKAWQATAPTQPWLIRIATATKPA
jgi:SAM-dependent methyltransferase